MTGVAILADAMARNNPERTDAKEALKSLSQRNDRIGIAAGVRLSRLR